MIKQSDVKIELGVKPLSVNDAWRGRRFKTDKYKKYERDLFMILPKKKLPKPPFSVEFEFGFSNIRSDWDNPVKPLQDILQKKYGFDDKEIYEAKVIKTKVSKGKEFIKIKIKQKNEKENISI